MNRWFIRALPAVAAAALITTLPLAAQAQTPEQQPMPSYASPVDSITGTISSIDGLTVHVRDVKGYVDTVELHHGTVINPTGITLSPGFRVTIDGRPNGQVFDADVIDTPYHVIPAYYGYPYYGYPYYGYGYGYPYGGYYPFNAGFGFGFGGGFHGHGRR